MNSNIEHTFKSEIDKLIYLYKSKNYSSALNLSNKLIEIKNDSPFLYNLNGLINLSLEDWQNALSAFNKTLKHDNKFIEAYNNLGVTYSHLGNDDKAIENYKKAIELNKDYANAYNNLATQYDDFGKYSLATKYYTEALRCNPKHFNAQNNLINLLNFHQTNQFEENPIIKTNNQIQRMKSKIFTNNKILTFDVGNYINDCNKIIIKNFKKKIFYLETQIHKRNGNNLNCDRHKKVFNNYNIIPEYCFSCIKVQIELREVSQLIKLFFILNNLVLPKNNIRKSFIELRENVKGNYKALIYCSSIDDAKSVYKLINVNLENSLKNFKLDIKRGCTEFNLAFPGYKDIKKVDQIVYKKDWKKKEELTDIEITNGSKKRKKVFSKSINYITLSEILIINNWLSYAKIIGDQSYKEISPEFIFSEHVFKIAKKNTS